MVFQDGLGERRESRDAGGAGLEALHIRPDLAAAPSFEFALRERVNRLAAFRHPAFVRVRTVERISGADQTLVLTSDAVSGVRLSDLLTGCEARHLPISLNSAMALIRQLVPAIAFLHETARDAAHGALAPERLIVAPNARLLVAEYTLGSALEQLLYSRERYWTDLRVALPRGAGLARFDPVADATQIGVVALALILGRPLRADEYPARIGETLASARSISPRGDTELLPRSIRLWLERTLQLDPHQSFPSAVEARVGLSKALEEAAVDPSSERLEVFLARYHGTGPDRMSQDEHLDAPAVDALPAFIGRIAPSPEDTTPDPSESPEGDSFPEMRPPSLGAFGSEARPPFRTRLVAAASVAAILIGSGATMAARRFLGPEARASLPTGTLVINTDPTGALARIDGVSHGVTPLTLALSAGPHRVELRGAGDPRTLSVTIVAGGQMVQYVDLPKPVVVVAPKPPVELPPVPVDDTAEKLPLAGWLSVSGPFDVQVLEHGQLLGTSASTRIMVSEGRHSFDLVNDEVGYHRTRTVEVGAGKVSTVTLDPPKGSLSLNALPWADVVVDGEPAGETPLGNLTLPIGPHTVVFHHPDLGERRYVVLVTLKEPARLSVDLRSK